MLPGEMGAYNTFLQTGKIEDYLKYVGVKQQLQAQADVSPMGGSSAYHDRGDRTAGAGDR